MVEFYFAEDTQKTSLVRAFAGLPKNNFETCSGKFVGSENFRLEYKIKTAVSPIILTGKWRKDERIIAEIDLKYIMSRLSEQQILARARASSLENVKNLNFW